MVVTKSYTEPPICKKEILRYAGCKKSGQETLQLSAENAVTCGTDQITALLEESLEEILPRLSYKVCYIELSLVIEDDVCDFGCMRIQSKDLVKNLQGCDKVVLFAATIGVEIDRLIARYGHISPAKAVMLQAIGAERIEALCDALCESIQQGAGGEKEKDKNKVSLRPRFSPGYGDLPLETQKDIFRALNCSKNIGLSLNDSLLMSPSKSVTAFVGLAQAQSDNSVDECRSANVHEENLHNCAICKKTDCVYRI